MLFYTHSTALNHCQQELLIRRFSKSARLSGGEVPSLIFGFSLLKVQGRQQRIHHLQEGVPEHVDQVSVRVPAHGRGRQDRQVRVNLGRNVHDGNRHIVCSYIIAL